MISDISGISDIYKKIRKKEEEYYVNTIFKGRELVE